MFLGTCIHAASTQIVSPTKATKITTSTTGVLEPDVFSGKTSTACNTDPLAVPGKKYKTHSTSSTSSSYASRLAQSPQVTRAEQSEFIELPKVIQEVTKHDKLNLDMTLEQAIAFALIFTLSVKPWLSLYYEVAHHTSNMQLMVVPLFYTILNFMYYQCLSTLKFDMFTLLKRTAGIVLSLHLLAQLFTYQLLSNATGLVLHPGDIFSLLSVTTLEARLILILAHFTGAIFAGYFAYRQ